MKLPYSLLPTTLAIGFLFSSATEAPAFGGPPGGPFSNGSYFPNDGTFSAVVRGENLTGTLQFSTTAGSGPSAPTTSTTTSVEGFGVNASQTQSTAGSGGVGSTGIATIYYDGDTYLGNSQGSLNGQSSTMAVNFQVDAQGQGEQQSDTNIIVDLGDLITETTTIDANGNPVIVRIVTPQREITTGTTITYFDSLYLNGFANCKTSNAFPNQKFEGDGEAEFQQLVFNGNTPFLDAVTMPIYVTGVRLSDTAATFNVSDVRPPSYNEFTVQTP
jgi:hypothetical protein